VTHPHEQLRATSRAESRSSEGRAARCRAHILEFRGVGRHEGAKALISERTPRQTERRRRGGGEEEGTRMKGGGKK